MLRTNRPIDIGEFLRNRDVLVQSLDYVRVVGGVSEDEMRLSGLDMHCSVRFEGIVFEHRVRMKRFRAQHAVKFVNCKFRRPVEALAAHFRESLSFQNCIFESEHGHQPDLCLDSARIDGLLVLEDSEFHGQIDLSGAVLGNSLRFTYKRSDSCKNLAHEITAPAVVIAGGLQISGVNINGAVDLHNARIGSSCEILVAGNNSVDFKLDGMSIGKDLALNVENAIGVNLADTEVGGTLEISERSTLSDLLNLNGAHVKGAVLLSGVTLKGGLAGENLQVDDNLVLKSTESNMTTVGNLKTTDGYSASLWIRDATIAGSVDFTAATFTSGVSLARTTIGSNLYLESTCQIGNGNLHLPLSRAYSPATAIPGEASRLVVPIIAPDTGASESVARDGATDEQSVRSARTGEQISLFLQGTTIRGSLHARGLKTGTHPTIADGLSCFDAFFDESTLFEGIADFSNADVRGDFVAIQSNFGKGLLLHGATIAGDLRLENARFGLIEANDGQITKEEVDAETRPYSVTGIWQKLKDKYPTPSLSLENAKIAGNVTASGSKFAGPISADFCKLSSSFRLDSKDAKHRTVVGVGFHSAGFAYSFSAHMGKIGGGLYARSVRFFGGIDLSNCEIAGDASFSSHIKGHPTIIGASRGFNNAGPNYVGLWLLSARIGGQLQVRRSYVAAGLCLQDVNIRGTADLDQSFFGSSHWLGGYSEFSLDARSATIQGPLRARSAVFLGSVRIRDSKLAGLEFQGYERETEPRDDEWPLSKQDFSYIKERVLGDHTTVGGFVSFTNCAIGSGFDFRYATFEGSFEMQWQIQPFAKLGNEFSGVLRSLEELEAAKDLGDRPETESIKLLTTPLCVAQGEPPTSMTLARPVCECVSLGSHAIGVLADKELKPKAPSTHKERIEPDADDLAKSRATMFAHFGENISLMLQGLHVRGSFKMRGLTCKGGANLRASFIDGALFANPFKGVEGAVNATTFGQGNYNDRTFSLRLSNAVISGYINAERMKCEAGVSISGTQVGGDVLVSESIFGAGSWKVAENTNAALLADELKIGGDFIAKDVTFMSSHGKGCGMEGQGLQVGKRMELTFKSADEARKSHQGWREAESRPVDGHPVAEGTHGTAFIDLSRITVPGRLIISVERTCPLWLRLNEAKVGEFAVEWMGDSEPRVPEQSEGLAKAVESGGWVARRWRRWKQPTIPKAVSIDGLEFEELAFHPRKAAHEIAKIANPSAAGPESFAAYEGFKKRTKRSLVVKPALLLVATCFTLILGCSMQFNGAGGVVEYFCRGFIPLSLGCTLLYQCYTSLSHWHKIDAPKPEWWNRFAGTKLLLDSATYSQAFYVRVVDYFSSHGVREYSDALFNDMKVQESARDSEAPSAIARLLVKFTKISTKVDVSVLIFFCLWQSSTYCANFAVLHPLPQDKLADKVATGATTAVSPPTQESATQKTPAAGMQQARPEQKKTAGNQDPPKGKTPSVIPGQTIRAKADQEPVNGRTTAGLNVSGNTQPPQRPADPKPAPLVDRDPARDLFEPLAVMIPFSGFTSPTLNGHLPRTSITFKDLGVAIHVAGYILTAVVALYIAGLFRRHRYTGATE